MKELIGAVIVLVFLVLGMVASYCVGYKDALKDTGSYEDEL